MDRWPFIVLIMFNVLFYPNVGSLPAGQDSITTAYMPQFPWESGFSAAIDGLASGISNAGRLLGLTAGTIIDQTFHSLGMLASGTFGMQRVNMGTRNFSDYLGPNSLISRLLPGGQQGGAQPSASQPAASQPAASQPAAPQPPASGGGK